MLQFCDDFNSYGSDQALMLNGVYAQVNGGLVDDPDPLASGKVYIVEGTANEGTDLRKVLTTARSTVGCCARIWMAELPSSAEMGVPFFVFANASNEILVAITVDTTGAIKVVQNDNELDGATVIASSSGPVLVANAWQHVEAKVNFDGSSGSVEVRVEGVAVISASALNTVGIRSGPCAQIRQDYDNDATSNGVDWYIKDYVIWDTAGSYNTDFLGSVHVERLIPDGDVSLNWTVSTGATGFDLINESPPDDDDYIAAGDTPPAATVMSLSDLPVDVTSVKGLMTLVRAKKTDGGDGNLQVSLRSNGSDDAGADRPITTADTYWFDISEEDPDAAAAWTPAAVDAAQIVFDRTL